MRYAALLGALLLLAAAGPAAGASVAGGQAVDSAAGSRAVDSGVGGPAAGPVTEGVTLARQTTPGAAAPTTIEVRLRADRSARWRVTARYPLDDEAEVAAFRTFAAEFEAGEARAPLGAAFFRYVADQSGQVAGREMRVRNVTRTAGVRDGTGVVTLAVTWTNFLGRAGNGDLVLRDALLLPSGETWLASIDGTQRLVIGTPPGYVVNATSAPVRPREDAVVIDGPRAFEADGALVVTYRRSASPPGPPWGLVAVGGAVLVLGVVGAAYLRRRGQGTAAVGDGPTGEERSEPAEDTGPAEEGPEADAGPAGEPEDGDGSDAGGEDGVDPSLLSDEERVERLLEHNDGRMKQADIVRETGWSDAKVSQLLSEMADEGRVEKLRLGRENLISLPEDGDPGQ